VDRAAVELEPRPGKGSGMKTYFLQDIASHHDVPEAVSQVLPGQQEPWLLLDLQGDVIAYFNAHPSETDPNKIEVTADMSGHHYNEDKAVIDALRRLQTALGGVIRDDDDRAI
jgi:hypothetical protein